MKSNNINRIFYFFVVLFVSCTTARLLTEDKKPTFYIIGDSTVRNGDGSGSNKQWGWGSFIANYFDTSKIKVRNDAIGGRSSRTFINEGRWDRIMTTLKEGDYVIMQFGHNDGGPLDDTARARGTIRGTGDEEKEIYNPITKKKEVVHSFGWYMKKYINDAKSKGAIPIVCSPIPRNEWKDGKVIRSTDSYAKWAAEVAKATGAYFVDLNNLVALRYEAIGPEKVKSFFPGDHTHTEIEGAKLNAEIVVTELKKVKPSGLKKYYKAS